MTASSCQDFRLPFHLIIVNFLSPEQRLRERDFLIFFPFLPPSIGLFSRHKSRRTEQPQSDIEKLRNTKITKLGNKYPNPDTINKTA